MKKPTARTVAVVWITLGILAFILLNEAWFKPLFDNWIYTELVKWQTAIAALLALRGIVKGALYNAELGRKRDDEIRARKATSIAAAIGAEIEAIVEIERHIVANLHEAVKSADGEGVNGDFALSLLALPKDRTVYNQLSSQLGELHPDVVKRIANFHQVNLRIEMIADQVVTRGQSATLVEVKRSMQSARQAIEFGTKIARDLLDYSQTGHDPEAEENARDESSLN